MISVICLCFFLVTSFASAADITVEYFPKAQRAIIKGNADKTDIRKPVSIDILDVNGSLVYTSQKRISADGFEFKFPFVLVDDINEYTVKVSINGKTEDYTFAEGINFSANKSWNSEKDCLNIFGNFVYNGYAVSNNVTIVMTLKDSGEIVFEDIYPVEDDYVYNFSIDFSNLDYDEYIITLTTEKDIEVIEFAYMDTAEIINNLKDLSGENLAKALSNTENMELLSLVNWKAIDNSKVTDLSNDVFAILVNGIDDIKTPAELKNAIDEAVFTDLLNNASTGEAALKVADNYSGAHFGIATLITAQLYTSLNNETEKHEIFSAVAGKDIKKFDDIIDKLNDKILLFSLNKTEDWSQIKSIAEAYYDYLGTDKTVSRSVCANLNELKPFDSLESFVSKLNDFVEIEDDEKNISGNSSGNGGGGKGGYSSIKAGGSAPSPVVPVHPAVIFDDIGHVSWASEAITELYKKGILNGVADKTFDPDSYVTREQFVKLLVLAFNVNTNGDIKAEFKDVDQTQWYAKYITLATTNGIASGRGDGTFGIGETLTRQDAATLLYRLVKPQEAENVPDFGFGDKDNISKYALDAVNYLASKNVINGVGNGNFEPMSLCTRAQAAKIIYAVLGL